MGRAGPVSAGEPGGSRRRYRYDAFGRRINQVPSAQVVAWVVYQ
ncbi:hypothetical protein PB20LOC_018690 [Pectobacterium parmentieri]|nr:hypothetical protein [Pectobacterium parmentieri]AYH16966.1 hypothetical protein C5E23_21105 [Pectobacterium parmentieri]QPK22200.1 hypothetical protein PB20LOC_018690 [Pectobacterium parmentieri]